MGRVDLVSILVFPRPWKHKRLDLVPLVARELDNCGLERDFEFVLTLPQESSLWRQIESLARAELKVSDKVRNVGAIPVGVGPRFVPKIARIVSSYGSRNF